MNDIGCSLDLVLHVYMYCTDTLGVDDDTYKYCACSVMGGARNELERGEKGASSVKTNKSVFNKNPSPRHLYLCRVRCNFGTDDVFFPFLIAFSIRATW